MSFKAAIQAIRTALFYVVFIGQTAILAIVAGTIGLLFGTTPFAQALSRYWCRSNIAFLRVLTGVKTQVDGDENIPPGGCIIASKHQSDWDIFAIFPHAGRPSFIAKKELMNIPFFGWAARSLDCIEIDRKRGAQAIPEMIKQARASIDRGCRLIIYPEGTRRPALAPPDYRQGIVRLYTELNVPVVPVALNSGLFWGRNAKVIWPGTARARFLPPIEPGLSPDVFMQRLREAIETESNHLSLEAIDQGIGQPLDDRLKSRVAELRAGTNH
ncbi:1-acyl-sn-glycerol-3-phosphate acyltransferase [Devosia sp. XJ19-1]|uniref:1-acyl-sn-glycerol-3-phosphate acyltransferase n=1 Tax=Devosia ureilytica TaxID=2952754 RepID=A0A9Q4FS65_9HYPH|nr:lysophospholipid acyltransferase family protein [Devosia ureilytica]MCP8882645.1 1-acyl-sn-glycerol-3-phosphate acyltransferase [Devosia ureilytica]MCP8886987.1 1-acyl-sn-glycerol-3-phosphate acyltransferase [Devosia ureilytica]